jgi:hypothetical protein
MLTIKLVKLNKMVWGWGGVVGLISVVFAGVAYVFEDVG